MEVLKAKICDVLVGKITILEFENWLYGSDLLKEDLKANSLVFKIVNINYRDEDSKKILKEITSTIFKEEDLIVMKIESNCNMIINSKSSKKYESYVLNIIENYDFDIEYDAYWSFYSFYYAFDGYEFKNYSKSSKEKLNLNVLEYAKSTIESLKNCKSIEEKKKVLSLRNTRIEIEKRVVKQKKDTFKSRFLAFFKKK